jgi:hypothetical protein
MVSGIKSGDFQNLLALGRGRRVRYKNWLKGILNSFEKPTGLCSAYFKIYYEQKVVYYNLSNVKNLENFRTVS